MDALPITEETGVEYASRSDGVMHACGHDAHVAIGLTVARMLNEVRDSLAGTVKLVFQPAEELLVGAKRMVDEGVLQDPRPDYSLALHLWNGKPSGWIGVPSGPALAEATSFNVHIRGPGGHGAFPHLTRDPIIASAQVITGLQSIVSRNIDALETGVVTVASVHGGEAFNVIPPEVNLLGMIRTYDRNVQDMIEERFTQVVKGVSESMGCEADVVINHLTSAVVNDSELSSRVRDIAKDLLPDGEIDTTFRSMASEDMAYMMDDIAGCYFFLGSSDSDRNLDGSHHDPRFGFDEQAMPRAAALMAATVMDLLQA
jgi:amidohydrolase